MTSQKQNIDSLRKVLIHPTVIVAALGYFVDIYDLVLFSIVRVPSLSSLGSSSEQIFSEGVNLINLQMFGMLVGGLLWGVMGDKWGRVSVLFGSILMYSLANLANAFITSVEQYKILRFIAGVGLAGELGAAITLVAEVLPRSLRGYGTAVVAGVGVSGAILAGFVAELLDWRAAYFVGGLMGLALLFMRLRLFDSAMFVTVKETKVTRGRFLSLFTSMRRLKKYLCCILIGVPIWFVIGVLVTFSPEISRELGLEVPLSASIGIMCAYGGLVIGDFSSGFVSQYLQSRRRTVAIFVVMASALTVVFLNLRNADPVIYYGLCVLLGIASGYWAMFVTIAAEQFGTNIRATVTTTVPNFVRGAVVPLTLLVRYGAEQAGLVASAFSVGMLTFLLALIAVVFLEETFHKDLDYHEI